MCLLAPMGILTNRMSMVQTMEISQNILIRLLNSNQKYSFSNKRCLTSLGSQSCSNGEKCQTCCCVYWRWRFGSFQRTKEKPLLIFFRRVRISAIIVVLKVFGH